METKTGRIVKRAHVITVSDGVSAGTRVDTSGEALVRLLREADFEVTGPVTLELYAASSAVDTDFTAKLVETAWLCRNSMTSLIARCSSQAL